MLNEMVCATSFRSALFACLLTGCVSTTSDSPATTTEQMLGRWNVSLYYAPDAPPSQTEMVVTSVEGGRLEGSFYGSPFTTSSRITQRGSAIAFIGVTADGSGDYIHSGRLEDGMIEGQTLSTGREFLMTWRADRAPETSKD